MTATGFIQFADLASFPSRQPRCRYFALFLLLQRNGCKYKISHCVLYGIIVFSSLTVCIVAFCAQFSTSNRLFAKNIIISKHAREQTN